MSLGPQRPARHWAVPLLALQVAGETLFRRRPAPALGERPLRLIEPRRPGAVARIGELWRYRRIFGYFARRLVTKRYKRTWLGWLWIPLRPALDVGSRVLLFGSFLAVPSEGKPYVVFFLVGMSTWHLFAETSRWAMRSLEMNRGMLRRLYFPRLIVLAAAVVPSIIDYLLYVAILVLVVGYYLVTRGSLYLDIGVHTLGVVGGLALVLAIALGIGLWTSVYVAQARDLRFVLRYALGFWMYVTPVIYPLSSVPSGLRPLVIYNPMTAPIELVRKGLLGVGGAPMVSLWVSIATTVVLVVSGLWFFGRSESAAVEAM